MLSLHHHFRQALSVCLMLFTGLPRSMPIKSSVCILVSLAIGGDELWTRGEALLTPRF